ncbi:hypothetical protein V4C53_02020 [Paraburkholderia azotifigens]|uniref:hypothetical protein n=1 Tax=Paraburkholderia azotifigens TaxID=2057004 RepID=UPI00316FDCC6
MNVNSRAFFHEGIFRLLPFLLVGGAVSVYLGKDWSWDLLNYHFYNPWALTHHRWGTDLFPAQSQTFFNPLLDLPFYKFAASQCADYIAVFAMGIPAGIAAYILWRLLEALELDGSGSTTVETGVLRVAACMVGMTGAAGFPQIGSSTGEWPVSALVLGGVLALVLWYRGRLGNRCGMSAAGFAIGAAAALKLTALIPALAVTIALPILLTRAPRREFLRSLAIYLVAAGVAFVIFAGPWMWKMFSSFHNPLFPYFNGIFKSPLIESVNARDVRFVPHDVGTFFKLPLFSAFVPNTLHSEITLRDPRLLIGALIALCWLVAAAGRLLPGKSQRETWRLNLFMAVAYLVMYIVGLRFFGIYRYTIVLELLGAAMLFVALIRLRQRLSHADGLAICTMTFLGITLLTSWPDWGRQPLDGKPYFRNNLPGLPPSSLIVATTMEPIGYLVPQWPGNPAFYSAFTNISGPTYNLKLQDEIAAGVQAHQGPIYILRAAGKPDDSKLVSSHLHLSINDASCRALEQPVPVPLEICEADRS